MKKLVLIALLAMAGFVTPFVINYAFAQTTLTFGWEYDEIEAVHVTEWRLYQSHTSGGPYTRVPVSIMKVGDQATYEEVVPSADMLNGMVYFVLTAYGDDSFPEDQRESGYSNEVSHEFPAISAPYNLTITVIPD